jgi:hypothetical protein
LAGDAVAARETSSNKSDEVKNRMLAKPINKRGVDNAFVSSAGSNRP